MSSWYLRFLLRRISHFPDGHPRVSLQHQHDATRGPQPRRILRWESSGTGKTTFLKWLPQDVIVVDDCYLCNIHKYIYIYLYHSLPGLGLKMESCFSPIKTSKWAVLKTRHVIALDVVGSWDFPHWIVIYAHIVKYHNQYSPIHQGY